MLGLIEQQPNPVAQQVDRRLESRREDQSGGGQKFLLRELRAIVGGRDELAHQVVTGSAPQLFQVCRQPVVESLDAPPVDGAVLRPRQPDVEAGGGQLTEFEHARTGFVGHAEDVADDGDRQLAQ